MFYLYIQHRNKHEAWHLKGQILNWSHCSNIFSCNEKQKQLRQSNLSLPFLALLCTREPDSRAVSGLVYLCLPPVGICFSSRDGHAQKMKLVQDEFLTIASGHCWGPEPGPWVTVYCCGADWAPGAPAKPTDGDREEQWRAVTSAHQQAQEVSRPCRHKGRGVWKRISWEMIQLLCRAQPQQEL